MNNRPSTEVQAEIDALEAEARDLVKRIRLLRGQLEEAEARHAEVAGTAWSRTSLLARLRSDLEIAKRREADAVAPKVRIGSESRWRGEPSWEEYVIDGGGPKQLRIRRVGAPRGERWPRGEVEHHGQRVHPDDVEKIR